MKRKLETQIDSINHNLKSIFYNGASLTAPINTVACRHFEKMADEHEAKAEELAKIAHRPRRRILALFRRDE